MITTAGYDLNSICYEQYDYACKVRDGIIKDDSYYSAIFEASVEDDPFSEETWKKANPSYGLALKPDYIKREAEKARTNAAYLNTFLRLHLNIWTSVDVVWITDDKWKKCGSNIQRKDLEELLSGLPCYGGLDLSSKSDITAFTLIFPPNEREFEPEKFITLTWSWLPEDKGTDSADKNNNNYKQWVKDGWIEETAGNVIDYDYIQQRILEICEKFAVLQIAYDPYNSTQIVAKLEGEGLNMIPFRQGFVSMNFPTLEFEVKVSRLELLHDNNPVMRWMVSNGVLLSDTGGKLFKIGKNQIHQKIDGLITNIMALGLAISNEGDNSTSYLDTDEVLYVEI
jgi:phage terminase large subunit-like protein